VSAAVARGVAALASMPPTITASRPRWRREWRLESPFVAAPACEALSAAGASADTFAGYLRRTREPDGSWMFEPEGRRRWPPDADSTACSVAALARVDGPSSAHVIRRIADEQLCPDGLIRPWLHWHPGAARLENSGDAIVTANVVVAARRVSADCDALVPALDAHVAAAGVDGLRTAYYDSLPLRAYYLARARSDGPVAQLVRELLQSVDGTKLEAVDAAAALAAAALLGVRSTVDELLPLVLGLQQPDGGWPESHWFTDRVRNVWRSRTFSTALAVEALALTA
jgi:hypothetical protein